MMSFYCLGKIYLMYDDHTSNILFIIDHACIIIMLLMIKVIIITFRTHHHRETSSAQQCNALDLSLYHFSTLIFEFSYSFLSG